MPADRMQRRLRLERARQQRAAWRLVWASVCLYVVVALLLEVTR